MIEYHLPLLVSSDTNQGAENVSSDGSYFEIYFERPIIIPKKAMNVSVTVQEATVWNVVANITTGVNDQFELSYFDGAITVVYTITIPQGLYDLPTLDDTLNRLLVNAGSPSNLITLVGDNATQKTVIDINVVAPNTVAIDFTIANSVREVLGFDSQLIPAQSGPVSIQSDNPARFNNIEYFLIHSSLVGRGLRIGDNYNNTIAQVLIDNSPGNQIISRPFNPPPIPAQEIAGNKVSSARFWLTDQANNRLDTNGEIFSCRLVIHYYM